jgi:hypothetical protein
MSAAQRAIVISLAIVAVVLGIIVEVRSARTSRRMTDLDCYLRGAWAVRVGADPYAVEDDNNWHYNYPPFLAILLGPMADPPAGAEPMAALPFGWSVALWYIAGIVALVFAAHWLATAVETGLPRPPCRYGYAWWSLRLGPALLVMPAAARTVARGQVNTIVLFLLAGWIAGVVTARRMRAGMFLAFAACIKVIPAYLFLHTLWRRDLRGLLGGAIGLTLGLVALPVAVSGPTEALQQARTFLDVTLRPGVGAVGSDMSRHDELTSGIATDSQSIMRVVHNLRHPHPWFRPLALERSTLVIHWTAAGILTLLTLAIAGRGAPTPRGEVLFIGALTVVMSVISPVCHLHYFTFALPLVTALWAGPRPRWLTVVFGVFLLAHVASLFHVEWSRDLPAKFLREFGTTTVTTLALWAAALVLRIQAKEVGHCTRVDPASRAQLAENTSPCFRAARAA